MLWTFAYRGPGALGEVVLATARNVGYQSRPSWIPADMSRGLDAALGFARGQHPIQFLTESLVLSARGIATGLLIVMLAGLYLAVRALAFHQHGPLP